MKWEFGYQGEGDMAQFVADSIVKCLKIGARVDEEEGLVVYGPPEKGPLVCNFIKAFHEGYNARKRETEASS